MQLEINSLERKFYNVSMIGLFSQYEKLKIELFKDREKNESFVLPNLGMKTTEIKKVMFFSKSCNEPEINTRIKKGMFV
jgi:hypothetical protein